MRRIRFRILEMTKRRKPLIIKWRASARLLARTLTPIAPQAFACGKETIAIAKCEPLRSSLRSLTSELAASFRLPDKAKTHQYYPNEKAVSHGVLPEFLLAYKKKGKLPNWMNWMNCTGSFWYSIDQVAYLQEKDEELVKIPRPFFLTSTELIKDNKIFAKSNAKALLTLAYQKHTCLPSGRSKKPPLCKGRWLAKQDGGIVKS